MSRAAPDVLLPLDPENMHNSLCGVVANKGIPAMMAFPSGGSICLGSFDNLLESKILLNTGRDVIIAAPSTLATTTSASTSIVPFTHYCILLV